MPGPEALVSHNARGVDIPARRAAENPVARLYGRFDAFLDVQAGRGGIGAPELVAVRDLSAIATAEFKVQMVQDEKHNLQGQKGSKAKIGVLELEEIAYTTLLSTPLRRTWLDPSLTERYERTLDAFDDIADDLVDAHRDQVRLEDQERVVLSSSVREPMTDRQVGIEGSQRVVTYLRTKQRSLEDQVQGESKVESDADEFDVGTFFVGMKKLLRTKPDEEPVKPRGFKQGAVLDIANYYRAKSRLEEARLKDEFGLTSEQLRQMFPTFKPADEPEADHSIEARQHRLQVASFPRYDQEQYNEVFNTWFSFQVPLERQMIIAVGGASALTEDPHSYAATLNSFSATLELQARFEDFLPDRRSLHNEELRREQLTLLAEMMGINDPERLLKPQADKPQDGDKAVVFERPS